MRRYLLALLPLCLLALLLLRAGQEAEPPGRQAPAAGSSRERRQPREAAPERSPHGILDGRVLDDRGLPVAGAEIRAIGSERLVTTTSDGSGRFLVAGLVPGDYTLHARWRRLAAQPVGPVPVAAGERLGPLDLKLEPAASVEGRVRDAATGELLEGASVELAGISTTTDRAGRFLLEGLLPGQAMLQVTAAGYQRRRQSLQLQARPLRGVEIGLERGALVEGTVLAAGVPVAGATVQVRPYRLGGDDPAAGASPAATSGDDGAFRLAAPAGRVELVATGPAGDRGSSDPLDLAPGASLAGVEIHLQPAAALAGRVRDDAGGEVAGAEVRIASLEGQVLAEGASDGAGRFHFASLPAERLRVVASRDGATGLSAPLALRPGETAEVEVRLGGETLAGRVEDPEGGGIAGAQLLVGAEGAPRAVAAVVTSDAEGAFSLSGLPDGPLWVEATAHGSSAEARGVLPGGEPLRLVLGSGELVGVVLVDGRPAKDFTLAAVPVDPGRTGGHAARIASPDGTFRVPLPPGRYEVRAGSGEGGMASRLAVVPGAGRSDEVLLEIAAGAAVEGIVRDAEDGRPLAGVRLSVRRTGSWAFGQASDLPAPPATMSGPDGSFRLGGLPASGRAPVFAHKEGYLQERPAVVRLDEGDPWLEIELPRDPAGDGADEGFGGVGITLARWGGAVVASQVVEGGPGWQAGVRRGDRILAVDGAAVGSDLSLVIAKVRGPPGTPVTLDLVRGDHYFRAVPLRARIRY